MAYYIYIQRKQVSYMAHLFFIFTIPFISFGAGKGPGKTDDIPSQLLDAYSAFIDFNFKKAGEELEQFKSTGHSHPFEWYIASMMETSSLLSIGDKKDYQIKKKLESQFLDRVYELSDDDPYKPFLISEIKMQWALVRLKFGDEFSAMWNLRQIYFVSKKAIKQHPDFLPLYKTYGFLLALFSGTPKKYQWIIKIFGINADMEKAVELLDKADDKTNPVRPESLILTALIHTYYYNNYQDALPICRQLLPRHPNSSLIRLVFAFILSKNSNDSQALRLLSGLPDSLPGYLPVPAWHYLLGEIYLHKGAYSKAIVEYNRFLAMQKGRDLIKDAHYKMAMCYWLDGNKILAEKELSAGASCGETETEMDKYADYMIRSGSLPDRQLLKARYYTDGGYFHKADSLLEHLDTTGFTSHADLVEYNYRKARLFHKTGDRDDAIDFYKKTISLQDDDHWYFAPNSCLQLGYLYMKNSPEKACYYFRKVFNYKFEIYQRSIQDKARLSLKKIENQCR